MVSQIGDSFDGNACRETVIPFEMLAEIGRHPVVVERSVVHIEWTDDFVLRDPGLPYAIPSKRNHGLGEIGTGPNSLCFPVSDRTSEFPAGSKIWDLGETGK
jgi:hypothetical protein